MNKKLKLRRRIFRIVSDVSVARWRPIEIEFRTGMVLVAAAFIGTNEKAIADLLGFSESLVARVAARCRRDRIWVGDKVRGAWMSKDGDFAFMLDAMVAAGSISREPEEGVTERGKAKRYGWRDAGLCTQCGRARSSERLVCDLCRAAHKARSARRKEPKPLRPMELRESDPRYASREISPRSKPSEDETLRRS